MFEDFEVEEPRPEQRTTGTFEVVRLLSRDPTLVVLVFAVWALLSGLALVGPGQVFLSGPTYSLLAQIGLTEDAWGAVMLCDAALLVRSALGGGLLLRSAVTAVSGGFWLYVGAHVLAGGYEAGLLSVVGCWDVFTGLTLLMATVQWAGSSGGGHAK